MPATSPGPTSRIFFSQRLRLHYVDWGNAEAPPLLLVHGGRDHCRNWDWLAERLGRDWHIIAPDLRGHGDSQWSQDGTYMMAGYVYDMAQLVHQLKLAPATILAHSLGGNIALRYAGLYPANVARLIAIEGLGPSPRRMAEREKKPFPDRMRAWIDEQRALSARLPRRYASIEDAWKRMQEENKHLTPEQARPADDGDADECCNQRVFDGSHAGLVFQETCDKPLHAIPLRWQFNRPNQSASNLVPRA